MKGKNEMADVTKKRFLEMLECVDDPVIEIRDRHHFRRSVFRSDVLLIFSGSFDAALERMMGKDIAPSFVIAPRRGIVLGSCRGTRYGMGDDGRERVERKSAKYERWLDGLQYVDGLEE